MLVILTTDDLVYDFKGNKKKATIKDFPGLEGLDSLGPFDVVIYNYNHETIILKGPIDENHTSFKVSKRNSGTSTRRLTIRHEESELLHQGSGSCGSSVQLEPT